MRLHLRSAVVAAAAAALLAPLLVGGPAQAALPAAPAPAAAAALREAARVDAVPTPRLDWYDCYRIAECATVDLPLDYDDPTGPTTEVAVLRVRALDPARRIGSLFVNPGGPGGSATQLASFAPAFLSRSVRERFDVVGVDPRGVFASEQVRCFGSVRQQTPALRPFTTHPFPVHPRQEAAWVEAAQAVGKGCSTTGRPLTGAMSTASTARDMDVVRRAVGDRALTFLGFSYGSYLGQVYANMFPDRVRAVAIDGVLDPQAWSGDPATRAVPMTERLRSGQGAYRALRELFERCDDAGRRACPWAPGDPAQRYAALAERLQADPIVLRDPLGTFRFGYAELVGLTLGVLYDPAGWRYLFEILTQIEVMADGPPPPGAVAELRTALSRTGYDFPYDNSFEAFLGVLCTDSLNPRSAGAWPAAADRADRAAPYFGRLWTWASAPCASSTWTVRDEDSYRGPFTRRTAAPVLVVGNLWDPATNYRGARRAAALLPHSRLLTSDSWGHTAYGSSSCVTQAVARYLLRQLVPAEGARCTGDEQPFREAAPAAARSADDGARAPVVPLLPLRAQG